MEFLKMYILGKDSEVINTARYFMAVIERRIGNHSVAIRGDDMPALRLAADRASFSTGRHALSNLCNSGPHEGRTCSLNSRSNFLFERFKASSFLKFE